MIRRMQKERITVSLDARSAARVRQCAATSRGGASGYVEKLIRDDWMREAVEALGRWYAAHPEYLEAEEAERIALAEERGENA